MVASGCTIKCFLRRCQALAPGGLGAPPEDGVGSALGGQLLLAKLGVVWGSGVCSALVSVEVDPVQSACAGVAVTGRACLQGVLDVDGFRVSVSCLGDSGGVLDLDISVLLPWVVGLLVWASEVLGFSGGAGLGASSGVSVSAAGRRGGFGEGEVALLSLGEVGVCSGDGSELLV